MTQPRYIADLLTVGWCRYALDDAGVLRELAALREQCSTTVRHQMASQAKNQTESTSTGQYGYTEDGDEGLVGLREVRSHVVFNQTVPADHPLQRLSPVFYGKEFELGDLRSLARSIRRMHEILDRLTIEVLETVELALGLPFGDIASKIAMGERLLRFQWYPRLTAGRSHMSLVDIGENLVPVHGRMLGENAAQMVRASPHRDIGHWTWQVYASDDKLRFWDPQSRSVMPAPSGEWIYGNICEFLAADYPTLSAPIHWVDADEEAGVADRVSVSYFAHARPSTRGPARLWGLELYERLRSLGYATDKEHAQAVDLLTSTEDIDSRLVADTLAWEHARGGPPPGFTYGLSRYYSLHGESSLPVRLDAPRG